MKNQLLIKSIIDYKNDLEQLKHAAKLNNRIEIQLLKDFGTNEWRTDSFFQFLKENPQVSIDFLHTPLKGAEEVDLIDIHADEIYSIFSQTFAFASEIQSVTNKPITVVCHYSGSFERLKNNECALSTFIFKFASLINSYPEVKVAIENIIPITENGETREGGFKTDNVELVKFLRQILHAEDRIFTVLDTCHAIVTDRTMQLCGLPRVPLEMFFKENQDTIALVHLANVRNLGYRNFEHGIGFTSPEDAHLLNEIDSLYKQFGNNCAVTIEVQERDYLERFEYQATVNALMKY